MAALFCARDLNAGTGCDRAAGRGDWCVYTRGERVGRKRYYRSYCFGKNKREKQQAELYAMDATLGARSHLLSHNADTTTDSRRTCTRRHHFCILYRVKREIEKKRDAIFIFMRAYVWCEGSSATYLPGLASRPPPWDSARRITRRTRMCEQIVRGLAEG